MVRPVTTVGVGRPVPGQEPEPPSRLGAFVFVLTLYLAFAGALIGLGYGLWPALAAATAACVVAGEVARRVITGGTVPAAGTTAPGTDALPDLLRDLSRILESGGFPGQRDKG